MTWRILFVCAFALTVLHGQVDVLTANYDNNRTNANLSEFVLNKSNVNPEMFGKLYSYAVDGEVYAQPLYVRGVNLGDGTVRNVLYVATMHNSVYAFDADAGGGTAPLWHVNFGNAVNPRDFDFPPGGSLTNPPVPGPPYTDILVEIGILGTPVIDRASSTLYVVHYTFTGDGFDRKYAYYLHALDLVTGAEKFSGPVPIQASVPGTGWDGLESLVNNQIAFQPRQHLQRTGLLLMDGTIYVAFGSHGDQPPWHGWLVAYDATTLEQTFAFNTTANDASGGSIWQGGRGLAADAADNLYCVTGNGFWDGKQAWAQSVLRLTTQGGISVADYFTPAEWGPLNDSDTDFGSTGPVLIPATNLLYAIGKEGALFLLDQTNLGHQATLNKQVVQTFQAADPTLSLIQQEGSSLIFNTAFWDNLGGQLLYLWPSRHSPRSYRMKNGLFETTPYSTNTTALNQWPMPGMTVSAYGSLSSSGILWATSTNSSSLPAPGTLNAFDALDLSVELWNSDMSGDRDTLGNFTKFTNPTVANGKVYQGTASGEVVVYGLIPDVPDIASVVDSASYSSSAVAPGELITVFGNKIGPEGGGFASVNPNSGQFPFSLGGLQVTFNGQPAPLLYSAAGQINAVAPFEVAGLSTVQMTINQADGKSLSTTLQVVASNPSIFSANASGTGQGAILNNADMTGNSASNPAPRGSIIAIFVTGAGVTTPPSVDGVLTSVVSPPLVAQPVTVMIGRQKAEVLYQGAAPGLVAGVSQIDVRIPSDITPGPSVPVTMVVDNAKSRNAVTIAVK
jgi:uncharacterized protein (TIGR03437 family)